MSDTSLASILPLVQLYATRSLLTVIFVLANVGCILNLFIFLSRSLRKSACSIYFLASSCSNIVVINFGSLLNILNFGYQINPAAYNELFCKLRNYFINAFGFISQSYIVLACIDRYMLSSASVLRRQRSSLRTAVLYVSLFGLFWIVESIHLAIMSKIEPGPFCYFRSGFYPLFISIHNMILSGFALPGAMIYFGILTLLNVHKIRRQAKAHNRRVYQLNRQDYNLIKMLVCQVAFDVVFALLYTLGLIYLAYATRQTGPQTANAYAVQTFVSYVAIACYYMPFCSSFYIYTLTSRTFRQELIKMCPDFLTRHLKAQGQTAVVNIPMRQLKGVAPTRSH